MKDVKQRLAEAGYPDAITFENPNFEDSFIGITHDGRAVYDYEQMIFDLVDDEGMTEEEAIDWISYNTLRSIPYWGEKAPVVVFPIKEI